MDKYMSTVKVGAKGQIVIPKEVRDMFNINPGDLLLLLADSERGIAIQKTDVFNEIADLIFEGKGKDLYPNEPEGNLEIFANEIKEVIAKGDDEE